MCIVRDIFHLQFGHFKEVKKLMEQAKHQGLMSSQPVNRRFLSDFTGESYRFIMEEGYNSLNEYELDLSKEMAADAWQQWYAEFKKHVIRSEREILKVVM
jgi:hypothetical protein